MSRVTACEGLCRSNSTRNACARACFSRSLLRSAKFLQQNCAIPRNAVRTSLPLVSSEKHAAQHPEKLRKKPSLNYKSAAPSNTATGVDLKQTHVQTTESTLYFSAFGNAAICCRSLGRLSFVVTKGPVCNEYLFSLGRTTS